MKREEFLSDDDCAEVPVGIFGDEEFYDEDDEEWEDLPEEEDTDPTPTRSNRAERSDLHVPDGERLQKVLSRSGVASRRHAEKLIAAGRVSVDGEVVTQLGVRVDPATQDIRVDGTRVRMTDGLLTIMLNKPAGVVTTMDDPQGRPTVADYAVRYVADHAEELAERFATSPQDLESLRLVHVGRLDAETEGLLLLTNDGQLAHHLTHPSFELSKTYLAIVEGRVQPWEARQLTHGITLEDGHAQADKAVIRQATATATILEITLHSGKNRIVRRMCAAIGHPVTRLARTRMGGLTLSGLTVGAMRELRAEELGALYEQVGL